MNRKKTGKIDRAQFYADVYEVVKLIPKGRVSSYGAIARYLGANKASRLVGYALAGSFEGMDVPAHRVVNRNGLLSGAHNFPKDRPMDKSLEAEGVKIIDMQVQDFKKIYWDPNEELL